MAAPLQSFPDPRTLEARPSTALSRLMVVTSKKWACLGHELRAVSDRTVVEAHSALREPKVRWRKASAFVGPAVLVSIAYVDPGNVAANMQAGARYGYDLLWVILVANLIAILFQELSARLGIVTGKNLAELARDHFAPPIVWAMWVCAEIAAMATDIAEFVGGALGISILLHLALLPAMVITAIVAFAIVSLQAADFRPIEIVIAAFLCLIALGYVVELFIAPPEWGSAAIHALVPSLHSNGELTLAVAMVGATVMPHAIYLHSGLTQHRIAPASDRERSRLVTFSRREVIIVLTIAGLINFAMVLMAAASFHQFSGNIEIDTAYRTLIPLFGAGAAAVFMVSLIASGVSSSVVGVMASQVIMQGFVGFNIPLWLRRLVTMAPAFALVICGISVTKTLVISQVVLSMTLPVPMISLMIFTGRKDIVGEFVSGPLLRLATLAGTVLIIVLNFVLLFLTY
jgi:manganese transport protein